MSSTRAHLQTRGQYEYHIEPLDNMTTSAAIFDQLSIQICLDEDETRSGTLAQSRVLLDLGRIGRDVRANCTASEWCYEFVSMKCAPTSGDRVQKTEYETCKAILDQQVAIAEYKAVSKNKTRDILRVRRQNLIDRKSEEELNTFGRGQSQSRRES